MVCEIKHLCDFFTLSKYENYVTTSSIARKFSQTRTFLSQTKNIPTCQKSAQGSSSFFNQFYTYKHIYIPGMGPSPKGLKPFGLKPFFERA